MVGCKDSKNCREQHLCKLVKRGDFEQVKKMVRDAAFVCRKCGRAARERVHLCEPEPI